MTKLTTKSEVFVVTKGSQRESFIKIFNSQIENADKSLEKFRQDMVKDPMRAFQWADFSFESAAKHSAFSQVLYMLQSGQPMENIREILTDNIMNGAKYVPSSTSRSSNYIKLCETAQQAEALNMFRHVKDLEAIV